MSWFAVDDRFWSHRKTMRLRRSEYFAQAIAVWMLAGSWCAGDPDGKDTGAVPLDVIAGLGVPEWELAAKALVMVGLFDETDDPDVISFHDWDVWNGPGAKTKRIEKRMEDDRLRQQRRRSQASAEGVSRDQEGLSRDESRDQVGQSRDSHVTSGKGLVVDFEVDLPSKQQTKERSSLRLKRNANEGRDDALRVCQHLARRIVENGSKEPPITVRWLDAARLLIDTDGRTEEQIHKAIDWCQNDEFWRANVLSLPTLREKYDQLRLKALEKSSRPPAEPPPSKADAAVAESAARYAAMKAAKSGPSGPPQLSIEGVTR